MLLEVAQGRCAFLTYLHMFYLLIYACLFFYTCRRASLSCASMLLFLVLENSHACTGGKNRQENQFRINSRQALYTGTKKINFFFSFFDKKRQENQFKTALYTGTLFPGVCFVIFFTVNFIAWTKKSSTAVPFGPFFLFPFVLCCESGMGDVCVCRCL